MEFKILHLYYDILNLYGEHGNVLALERYLSSQGGEVTVDKMSLGETPNFNEYDIVYLGSGTEEAEITVLEDIKQHRTNIINALDENVIFLATGNSFELFGREITDSKGVVYKALSLFDFTVTLTDKSRTLCDQLCSSEISPLPFVGFINKASEIYGIENPIFSVIHGKGNHEDSNMEGIREGSFFGTHLTGPCLVKNPHLAEFVVKIIDEKKGIPFAPFPFEYEKKAYQITLNALNERFSS